VFRLSTAELRDCLDLDFRDAFTIIVIKMINTARAYTAIEPRSALEDGEGPA